MTEIIKQEDNREILKKRDIDLVSVLSSLKELTSAKTLKGGDLCDDNPARMNAITELLEMAGFIADKEDEELYNKILGQKIESLYEEVQRELEQMDITLDSLIKNLKELQTAITFDRQGEIVPENSIRLKATKMLAKIGKWKKGKKQVNVSMSITQYLASNDNLSLN